MTTLRDSLSEYRELNEPLRRSMRAWWRGPGLWWIMAMQFLALAYAVLVYLCAIQSPLFARPDLSFLLAYGWLVVPIDLIMVAAFCSAMLEELALQRRWVADAAVPGLKPNYILLFRRSAAHLVPLSVAFALSQLIALSPIAISRMGAVPLTFIDDPAYLRDFYRLAIQELYVALLLSLLAALLVSLSGNFLYLLALLPPAYMWLGPAFVQTPGYRCLWIDTINSNSEIVFSLLGTFFAAMLLVGWFAVVLNHRTVLAAVWRHRSRLVLYALFSGVLAGFCYVLSLDAFLPTTTLSYDFQSGVENLIFSAPANIDLTSAGSTPVYKPGLILLWNCGYDIPLGWPGLPLAILLNTLFIAVLWRVMLRMVVRKWRSHPE